MRNILFLLFIILTVNFPSPANAAARTVCKSGCQYSTIQSAINAASTGDIITVSSGTYNEKITLNKALTLQAQSYDANNPKNNTVIIDAGGTLGGVIDIPSGVSPQPKIIGFQLKNAASGTLSNSPFTIESCYLTGADDLGEYEKGSGGIARGNIYEGGGDDGIDLDNQINSILIEYNQFLGNNQDGLEIRLQDDSISGMVDIIIRNNRIEGNGSGGDGDGIQIIDYYNDTNRRFTIDRNLILNNNQAGLGLMDGQVSTQDYRAASIREEIRVTNNTFIGNNHGISGGDNMLVVNNIFKGQANLALKNVDSKSKIINNLFWQNGTNFTGSNVDTASTKTVDPLLSADYHLQSGSPAIDAGTNLASWINIKNETINFSVPAAEFSGTKPDLGKFESNLSAPPPTVLPTSPGQSPAPTGAGKSGDANNDNKVDGLDYVIWLKKYNQLAAGAGNGDFNNSGKVDGLDYVIWLNYYNK